MDIKSNDNIETDNIPFYKKKKDSPIDIINMQYLLQASPFRREYTYNFSKRLKEDFFFNEFYSEMWLPKDNPDICEKNIQFDKLIRNELVSMENPDEKVSLFHLWGYAGCGKTTFIRHVLWDLSRNQSLRYNAINFEHCNQISTALETTISRLIGKNEDGTVNYLSRLTNNELFDLSAFERITSFLKSFSKKVQEYYHYKRDKSNDIMWLLHQVKESIEFQLSKPTIEMENVEDTASPYSIYIDFLLILLFFISIYKIEVSDSSARNTVILLDNVDSISNLKEEYTLLTAILNFLNASHLFFDQNYDNDNIITNGKKISLLIDEMKYSIFLTTRVVTVKRFRELKPDFEDFFGWDNHEMPEYFYNHEDIISRRLSYYQKSENYRGDSIVLQKMEGVYDLSKIVYRSSSFKRLFNGNIRFCFSTLGYIYDKFYGTALVDNCKRLNTEYDNKNPTAGHGANGIVLAMLLNYFKENDIYSKKLHLSTCTQDNKISLSRIILTILHENGGICSMLDIFDELPPKYVNERLCEYIWDLSERERDIWRRLLTFERKIPVDEEELKQQYKSFQKGERSRNAFTELILCRSGEVFLEIVLPHFEFMMSRCVAKKSYLENKAYHPLYCSNSLDMYYSCGTSRYVFEDKIDRVYKTVAECSLNSSYFVNEVIENCNYNEYTFINESALNYHEDDKSEVEGSKQSYIGRLVFSHVGYIESYRRYLKNSRNLTPDINKRLTLSIKKYLKLYKNAAKALHSERQDSALDDMLDSIKNIEISNFYDFNTKIETKKRA